MAGENRLAVINNRIRMLNRQVRNSQARIADYEERIARTPTVERDLSGLTRDYENLSREYQEILAKQQDAQLAENLGVRMTNVAIPEQHGQIAIIKSAISFEDIPGWQPVGINPVSGIAAWR